MTAGADFFWTGGFQPPGSPEPGDGYVWLGRTGQSSTPLTYTNWGPGEPSNVGFLGVRENAIVVVVAGDGWNDLWAGNALDIRNYVVEWQPQAAPDLLVGGAGTDTLDGGTGAETMDGGTGDDLFFVDTAGDSVLEASGGGADTIMASVSYTIAGDQEVEALALTGTGNINGTGNNLANTIVGNSDANVLNGGIGDDSLSGGAGADTMLGGAGNDRFVVDDAGDVVVENAGEGTDTVEASITHTLAAAVEALEPTGGSTIDGTGNTLANRITGNDAANVLSGGAGADSLVSGIGNERYTLDSAGDVILELLNEGNDSVVSSVSWTLGDNLESLQLTGAAGLTGIGNDLVNRITGNSGGNLMQGMGGNDVLFGLDGADTLQGGTGADSFFFAALADGVDRIVDFVSGTDFIVATTAFGGGLAAGALDAARFVSHASANATSAAGVGQFVYHSGLGTLYYDADADADGGGGAAAVRFATLSGAPALAVTDFVIA